MIPFFANTRPTDLSFFSVLRISGFSEKFYFHGFLPDKEIAIKKDFELFQNYNCSIVFFISAQKLIKRLDLIKNYFVGRQILICREITKIHESFIREEIKNLKLFKNSLKGELTVVISEVNNKSKKFDDKKISTEVRKYLKKYSLKDTVDLIFQSEKLNKKKIYQLCLKIKNEKNN